MDLARAYAGRSADAAYAAPRNGMPETSSCRVDRSLSNEKAKVSHLWSMSGLSWQIPRPISSTVSMSWQGASLISKRFLEAAMQSQCSCLLTWQSIFRLMSYCCVAPLSNSPVYCQIKLIPSHLSRLQRTPLSPQPIACPWRQNSLYPDHISFEATSRRPRDRFEPSGPDSD